MVTKFQNKVYNLTKKIPSGKITTYKVIAKKLKTRAYRAVGTALNKNPFAPKVPCHRVVNSNGYIGGFARGIKNKTKMLKKEGIIIKKNRIIDFERVFYKF